MRLVRRLSVKPPFVMLSGAVGTEPAMSITDVLCAVLSAMSSR